MPPKQQQSTTTQQQQQHEQSTSSKNHTQLQMNSNSTQTGHSVHVFTIVPWFHAHTIMHRWACISMPKYKHLCMSNL